ncbi:MAG: glycosyltransferase family 2 protein [Verrucomicrobia bacterium]|nr:glycosyltransferase family 2 protein [Verrucomicrobiota bacterium]
MDWTTQCVAVIPCFNEARHIADVIGGVRAHLPNIIVVDDGSTDATAEIANRACVEVLQHTRNLGKGTALRAGFDHAHQRGFKWVIMLDGDGQHSAEEIPRFFKLADTTGGSLIVGNRMGDTIAMPWLRRFVNRWMSRRLSKLTGIALADSQCGFRLVNLDAYSRMALTTQRFEIESEMLVAFAAARYRIGFVPVRTIYKAEASKIHPLLDTWRWFSWWLEQLPGSAAILPASSVGARTETCRQDAGAPRGATPLMADVVSTN